VHACASDRAMAFVKAILLHHLLAAGLWRDFVCLVAADTFTADGKVHDLTAGEFDSSIKSFPLVFVEFYAPWCGHCKKLAPEWEKVAVLAQKDGVPVAKVDAIAEKKLADEHQIRSFPTLKLFRGDPHIAKLYNGPRTAEKMTKWLTTWKEAVLLQQPEPSVSGLRIWAGNKTISLLGVRSGDDTVDQKMQQVVEAASFELNPQEPHNEVPVGIIGGDKELLQNFGIQGSTLPLIVLMRSFEFEDSLVVYRPGSGEGWNDSYGSFSKWLSTKRVPTLIPAQRDTERFFLQDIEPGNGLVLYFGQDAQIARIVHEQAVGASKTESRLKWVHAVDDEFGISLGKNVGITKADYPAFVLWEFGDTEDDDKVYKLATEISGGTFQGVRIKEFIAKWQADALSAETDPVMSVSSDTFEELVINNERNVLVEFYAPWCGHCKALAPEYKQVALHYETDDSVAIAKMDATKHKHQSADIKSYPTIKLYAKGRKHQPIDLGFKANRNKNSLVDFVEAHRGKGSPKRKQADKDAPPNSPPEAPAEGSQKTFWIFDDDAAEPRKGVQLTADMVNSRGGYTLIQADRLGLLVSAGPSAVTRAVRHFDSEAQITAYRAEKAVLVGAAAQTRIRHPCPAEADIYNCQTWCSGVSPSSDKLLRGTLGGKPCSEYNPDKAPTNRPSCMCYDEDFTGLYAMCTSPCRSAAASTGQASCALDGTCATSTGATVSQLPNDIVSGFATSSGAIGTILRKRYFLYDTKYGEGFNLQREVYPRAAWIVAQMNKRLQAKCGSDRDRPGCERWSLVLPPWCQVMHWESSPDMLPWASFFDMSILRKTEFPVIEFEEYVKEVGGAQVDLAVVYTDTKVKGKLMGGTHHVHDNQGGWLGWAEKVDQCKAHWRKIPEHTKDEETGNFNIVYSGDCEGGVDAKDFRCASLNGPWPSGVVDMLGSLDKSVSSVLVKAYDYLLAPDNEDLDAMGLRESMLFSKAIRDNAEAYIKSELRGEPYVSAHCRRTDFLSVRSKTTPNVQAIADKLNNILAETGLDRVFIATDAPNDLRAELQQHVQGSVNFYRVADGASSLGHSGKQAAAEIWIAARADYFVGTQESRFTMWIQLERQFQKKPVETSEQEFCKSYKNVAQKCLAPKNRRPQHNAKNRKIVHPRE